MEIIMLACFIGSRALLAGTSFTATNTWGSYRAVLTEKKNKIGTTIVSEYDYIVKTKMANGRRSP